MVLLCVIAANTQPELYSTKPLEAICRSSTTSLYELVAGQRPYQGLDDATINALYRNTTFPPVEHPLLREVTRGC